MALKQSEAEKKQRMAEIVADLKKGMDELEDLGRKIRMEGKLVSPGTTKHLLEEIKVPYLKMIKEK